MPEKIQPTPRRERIAIAGATGRVGSALTSLLAYDPVDIVALTRRPDAAQPPNGVTIAAIDFDRPYTLQEALRGADRIFVSHGSSLRQVANEIALIDSAVAVGVRHIVKLSALGPATRLNHVDRRGFDGRGASAIAEMACRKHRSLPRLSRTPTSPISDLK